MNYVQLRSVSVLRVPDPSPFKLTLSQRKPWTWSSHLSLPVTAGPCFAVADRLVSRELL